MADTDPADGEERLTYEWADPHVNVISHAPDEIGATETGCAASACTATTPTPRCCWPSTAPRCWRWRPPTSDLTTAARPRRCRAFRLEKLDAIVLHRGTWHWGPFPLGGEPVLLFNVQGLGYAHDNASADLASSGMDVVVVPGE